MAKGAIVAKNDKVQKLIAGASSVAICRDARVAWTRQIAAALRDAQRAMDDRLGEVVMSVSEDEFDRLFDAEQAKVDALLMPMRAAAEEDKWPRYLHVSGL